MSQSRRTRKLRRGGGWFSSEPKKSNANIKRASNDAIGKIKESNAKATVRRKAETAAANRRDYKALDAKKDKLILERRKAAATIEDIEKDQKRMVNEELKKEAEKWLQQLDKKPGWFS
jgi:hypothetical protein